VALACSFTSHEPLRLPRPGPDFCLDCKGWGYELDTTGADRPLCPRCHGHGGQQPHDLDCPAWGPVVLVPGSGVDPAQRGPPSGWRARSRILLPSAELRVQALSQAPNQSGGTLMALAFIDVDEKSGANNSPTIWIEDATGDLIVQSWDASPALLADVRRGPGRWAGLRPGRRAGW